MSALRVRYQTIELGGVDIHVKSLRDTQEYRDEGGEAEALGISSAMWPLFGVLWTAGIVLAELMVTQDIQGRRILEVGCGLGLASLLLNQRSADITATDQHPEAATFLASNVALNEAEPIPFVRVSWADAEVELGLFDLIIGADLLYDREQAEPLSRFIEQHANPACEVVLVDAGRGQAGRFSRCMSALGYAYEATRADDVAGRDVRRIQVHHFQRAAAR
jgi:ETFB lysine methyltransferase